ncbi:MAG: fibronectin type III domain-containing protein, partial [Steroidobacteraceae bacterium]
MVARPAAAAVAYVQGAAQDPTAATSLSVTYTAAQTAGDLNVVAVGWSDATSRINSITDSKGNNYQIAVGPTTSPGNATQVLYYAQSIAAAAAGTNTVTITFNTSVAYPDVRVVEYSGIATSGALDVAVGASAGTGTALSSGSITTTNANDLLVGADDIGAGFNAVGSGYTKRLLTVPDANLVEDRVVSATGSYSASSTQAPSSWWVMQLAAFRAASSGGGGDTTPPTAPSNLAANAISTSQITLGWSPSSDNVGVTNYLVERCQGSGCTGFAQIGTSTTTSYNDTGLSAGTFYLYRVRATDAAGNLSAYSTPSAGTTTLSNPTGSIANVQGAAQDPTTGKTVAVVYGQAQTAGDLNVVAVGWSDSTSSVTSVMDTKGNNYQIAVGPTRSAGNATQVLYYAQSIAAAAAGTNTVTVTF